MVDTPISGSAVSLRNSKDLKKGQSDTYTSSLPDPDFFEFSCLHILFGSMLIVSARSQISSLWGTFFETPMKVSLAKLFFGLDLDILLDWDPITEVNFYKIQ